MIMRLYGFSGLVKSKSDTAVTASAFRKYCSGYGNNPMEMSVIFSIEFVMNHIIDTGGRYFVSWLKFIHLSYHLWVILS